MNMSIIHARLKAAVINAVDNNGGIDGAAATCDLYRSTPGRWRNVNEANFPAIHHALSLDQISVAATKVPSITKAMASELGYALVKRPDGAEGDYWDSLSQLPASSGDLLQTLALAVQDKKIDSDERADLLRKAKSHADEIMKLVNQLESGA